MPRIQERYPTERRHKLTGWGERSGGASGSSEGEEDSVDELHLEYLLN